MCKVICRKVGRGSIYFSREDTGKREDTEFKMFFPLNDNSKIDTSFSCISGIFNAVIAIINIRNYFEYVVKLSLFRVTP